MLGHNLLSDKEWIQAKPSKLRYTGYAVLRVCARTGGRIFASNVALGTVLLRLVRVALIATISLVPVIFAKLVAPALGLPPAPETAESNPYYQAGFLFALLVIKSAIDRLQSLRKSAAERLLSLRHLSISLESAIAEIERQIRQFDNTPEGMVKMDAFLQHALKCIEATVQLCTDNTDARYFCVTLLTFENSEQILIRARSTNERAYGMAIPAENTFAYMAAKYAPNGFVIHDFKRHRWFQKKKPVPFRGLSSPQEEPPYRSILVLPLPAVAIAGQNFGRKGVVTIDSAAPYEFLGKEMVILIRVAAYLHLINIMLRNHAFGIEPEV